MVKLTKQRVESEVVDAHLGSPFTVYNSKWYDEETPDIGYNHGEKELPEEASEGGRKVWRPNESNWMDFQVHAQDELLPIYDDCVRANDWYCRRSRGCHPRFAIGEGSIPAPADGDFNHARRTHQYYQSVAQMREVDKKAEEERIQNG